MQKGISPATAVIIIIVVIAIVAVVGYMKFGKKPGAAAGGGTQVSDDAKAKMQQVGKMGMGMGQPGAAPAPGGTAPAPGK